MFEILYLTIGDYLNEEDTDIARKFCNYLLESGLDSEQILALYEKSWISKYDQIAEACWENSLLKPHVYYYHTRLRTQSAPVRFNSKTGLLTESEHYNEMKIMLTAEQVIDEMYELLNTLPEFRHKKRDIEGLNYVLGKHYNVHAGDLTLQTIDVIYVMMDRAKKCSYGNRLSFLEIYNAFFNECLITLEEMCITPQKSFVLRTGELITCHGK